MMTRRLGLEDADRRNIHFAALLHDIGKLRLDPTILSSEGPVSGAAMEHMREHSRLGLEILKPIMILEGILPTIHGHHERWDGKGYPLGLGGEEIPLGARIVALADSFDAMTRSTPHGVHRSTEEALIEIEACAGTQFDPRLAQVFVAGIREREGHPA
jgi:HD-GYP domain-containing protein (c-di-GMP phosphodiesterase class II)